MMNKENYRLTLGKPLGAWVWNVADFVARADEKMEFCKFNGVTELYFSINDDVPDDNYVDLIAMCQDSNITPCALTGDPNWIMPERQSGYFAFLERVDAIHKLCADGPKFYSLHMDVEPHVMPEAKEFGLENYIIEFVQFIKDARKAADERKMALEWDIPAWFHKFHDQEHDCTINETIIRYSDAVGIMAYSDSPEGQYSVFKPNLDVAKRLNKKIILGTETMDLDEARRADGNCAISYFEEGKKYMYASLAQINQKISEIYDNFGFAIHDIDRWMALQDDFLPQYASYAINAPNVLNAFNAAKSDV